MSKLREAKTSIPGKTLPFCGVCATANGRRKNRQRQTENQYFHAIITVSRPLWQIRVRQVRRRYTSGLLTASPKKRNNSASETSLDSPNCALASCRAHGGAITNIIIQHAQIRIALRTTVPLCRCAGDDSPMDNRYSNTFRPVTPAENPGDDNDSQRASYCSAVSPAQ